MDFSLTDEQQLLLDSVDELMERYGTEQYFKECDEKHVWPQEFTDALLENGSWSVTSGREMKKILEPLKGWSEVSAPITVKSALREDQLAAIDALADALAANCPAEDPYHDRLEGVQRLLALRMVQYGAAERAGGSAGGGEDAGAAPGEGSAPL